MRRPTAPASEPIAPASGLPAFDRSEAAPPAERSQIITIVAGLPRSGTSMMMQMLAAGGVQPYTDQQRPADQDNPRGYFEHERATRLHEDSSWLPEARGKAVKIVAHLLPYLPAGERYRVIFMHRDLAEAVASQRVMLDRLGRKGAGLTDERLMRTFTQQLIRVQTWMRRRPDMPVLAVQYQQALDDAAGTSLRLARFLGAPFDAAAAAAVVEPGLRRQNAREQAVPTL